MDLDPSLYRDRGYITQKAINTIITPSNVVEQNKKMLNFNQINFIQRLHPLALVLLTRDKVDNGWCAVCKGPAAVLSAPWGYCQNRDKPRNKEDTINDLEFSI